MCLVATHNIYDAEQSLIKAITIKPNFADLNLNIALLKLLQGNFEDGLPLYEWRWQSDNNKHAKHLNKLLWLGADNLAGKTILLHPEHVLGEYIQFCRYALDLEKMGATVILQVPPLLLSIVKTLSNKLIYVAQGQALPAFDFHCPVASLPMVLNARLNSIPTYKSYLQAPAEKKQFWQNKLGKKVLPRIGINWFDSTSYKNDLTNNLPVHFITTILRMNAEFHLLQKETKPRDWQILALNQVKNKLINHEADLQDFSDTAALIDEVDLVISVDTSVAHLAGALGKPLWLLIANVPDFRWLLDRDDSPLYPSVKLFRQTQVGNWKEIISQLNNSFENWLNPPAVNEVPTVLQKTDTEIIPISIAAQPVDSLSDNNKEKFEKAKALHLAGKPAEAAPIYKEFLAQHPNNINANNMLGTLYLQAGNLADAEVLLNKTLSISPKNAFALCNLAVIYSESKRKLEAIKLCEQAIEINSNFSEAHNNLGSYLSDLEENNRAIPYFKRAIELKPDYTDAHFNLGLVYYRTKQFALAESAFNTTIALKPDHIGVYYNLGLLKLLNGDFKTGLPLYEYRWQDKQAKDGIRDFKQPIWMGKENIKGKIVLLHSEQGHGDFIQFCRYAFDVEKLGAKVILEVHQIQYELAKTLSDNLIYIVKNDALPLFDFHTPLLSLPMAFNTIVETIPANVPYLNAPAEKTMLWKNKLGKKTLPRVGIVWSGTTGHLNDHNRSIALKQLGSLFSGNIEFHVLQKDIRASDMGALKLLQAFNNVYVHQHDLHNFTDTAALITEMDLVISVDTSVAHLAGALAKPVWILLSYVPDFRWLLDRDDSPWYPSARLFRQAKQGDWVNVIANVKKALEKFFLYLPTNTNNSNLTKPALLNQQPTNLRQQIDGALSLHTSGKQDAALKQFLSILQTAPDNTEVLTILATIYMQLNNMADSQQTFEKSLSLDNTNPLTIHNYGLLFEKLNRLEEAVKYIDAAIIINPQYEVAYHNKIVLLKKMGKTDAVIETLQSASAHIKQSEKLYYQLHTYLNEAERFDEALIAIDAYIALNDKASEAYNSRGNILLALKRPIEAVISYNLAIALDPKNVHALSNRSNAYLMLNQVDKSLDSCDAALAIEPTLLAALNNRAVALGHLKRFDETLAVYDTIISLDKFSHYAFFNKALLYLITGNFKAGWPLYESRWQALPKKPKVKAFFIKPLWLGKQPLNNKSILLHNEQGLGDIIQFCRYVYLVAKKGASHIYFTCPNSLYTLLIYSFKQLISDGKVTILKHGDGLPQFDYQCPIMSLPLALETQLDTIPASVPYLFADKSLITKWQSKLATSKKPKIGLVWSGSTVHINDHNRSLSLEMLTSLLTLPADFHCLQIEIRQEDKAVFDELKVINHQSDLTDFAQTAALVNELDLVITVDTSVAHLAGAMGKPVWIMLPYMPDYRWLLNREDSPWYPTARLFRQSKQGEWADVIVRLTQALKTKFNL